MVMKTQHDDSVLNMIPSFSKTQMRGVFIYLTVFDLKLLLLHYFVYFEVSTVWFSLKFVWIIFILNLNLKERHSLSVSMWVCVLHTLCQAWSGAAGRRRPAHSSRRWWSWWSSPRGSSWWPRGTRPAGTGLRWASLPEPDSGQGWAAGRGGGQRKRFWI